LLLLLGPLVMLVLLVLSLLCQLDAFEASEPWTNKVDFSR